MPTILSVSRSAAFGLGKGPVGQIVLQAGLGVEGDAHSGRLVRHRYLAKRDPTRPNLRQVHLIAAELLDELAAAGFEVAPGDLGENVTTRGIDLTALSAGTRLRLGATAMLEAAGLRDPCGLLNRRHPGLMAAVTARTASGAAMFRQGLMAVVVEGGIVRADDGIEVVARGRFRPLGVV